MAKDATDLTALDQPKAGRLNIQYAPDGETQVDRSARQLAPLVESVHLSCRKGQWSD